MENEKVAVKAVEKIEETEEDRSYCVYVHTNKINGKKYVGQTCAEKPEYRWNNGNGYKKCPYFHHAIEKYGWDNFEHEVVKSNLSLNEACQLEQLLIKKYNTMDQETGYNLTSGGEGIPHYTHTEETKAKISQAKKGVPFSEKHRKNISKVQTGKKRSNQHKENISKSLKGKKRSKETRRKMSKAITEAKGKKVGQYAKDGSLIKVWETALSAAKELGICQPNITACCEGKKYRKLLVDIYGNTLMMKNLSNK